MPLSLTDSRHDYRVCDDDYCNEFPCRIYKEGLDRGFDLGHAAGQAQGYAEGHRDGYADGAASAE